MNVRFVPRPHAGPASTLLSCVVAFLLAATAGACACSQSEPVIDVAARFVDLPNAPAPMPDGPVASPDSSSADLVAPVLGDSSAPDPFLSAGVGGREGVPLSECPTDETHARECRVHWHQLMLEAIAYDAFQNAGNVYSGYWYRFETTHGKWLDRYFDSVLGWRWDRWSDNNPFLDDYVGHPMMGSITDFLWIQNDPKGMTVEFGNNRPYWRSRMRAVAFSTAFSLQWKFGPFGEAGVGHNGDHYFYDKGVRTNETGWVELVTTPVGGLAWTVAEDRIDKGLRGFEQKPHNPIALLMLSFLTPSRATANILRFRPPWYRDGYVVKANSFWSDPPGADEPANAPGDENVTLSNSESAGGRSVAPGAVLPVPGELPKWPRFGGVHEFGAEWGASVLTGHLWGNAQDVRYMPIDVDYSYLLNPHRSVALRYAPRLTTLAMIDEPSVGKTTKFTERTRSYGAGISPVGFRASFLPASRVQPFLSGSGGMLAFSSPVLAETSHYLYSGDMGAGLTIFRRERQAVSIGYRYQHLSSPGSRISADTNTIYFQVSRFRTKGYR